MRQRTGFSLLEMIIATAILAAAAGLLLELIGQGSRLALKADRRSKAYQIADGLLQETLLGQDWESSRSGEAVQGMDGWTWQRSWVEEPASGMGWIVIEVWSRTSGQPKGATRSSAPGSAGTAPPAARLVRQVRLAEKPDPRASSESTSGGTVPGGRSRQLP
ncbi:MAG: prepilin-type N-terminal cleavage/methylation domain-containing protein [Pirellulaceae bacterium]